METPLVVNLNGLIILTSAIVIIAQYLNTKHKETINSIKSDIKSHNFNNNTQKAPTKLKGLWDNIVNEEPLSLHVHMVVCMLLFIIYSFTHITLLAYPSDPLIVKYGLLIMSTGLFVNISFIFYRLSQMRQQHDNIKKKREDFLTLHDLYEHLKIISQTCPTND